MLDRVYALLKKRNGGKKDGEHPFPPWFLAYFYLAFFSLLYIKQIGFLYLLLF